MKSFGLGHIVALTQGAGRRPQRAIGLLMTLAMGVGACANPASPPQAPTQSPGAVPQQSPVASFAGPPLYWASYEFHTEPRFRLIFEGGTPAPEEVRISDMTGTVRASSLTAPVSTDPLRLCARGTTYGTARATLSVAEDLFRDFIRDESRFVVEVRFGGNWSQASLANLCHATQ